MKTWMILSLLLVLTTQVQAAPVCAELFSKKVTVEELLKQSERSRIDEVMAVLSKPKILELKQKGLQDNESVLFKVYFEVIKEFLTISNGRTVYIFARDGEWIFDAVQTLLASHPVGRNFREKFKLINISRLIARSHSPDQLRTFLESNGMNLNEILSGKEKVIWFDTGNRGTIYLALYDAIIGKINFSESPQKVKSQIMNLIVGVEGLLISSSRQASVQEVLELISSRSWSDSFEVYEYLRRTLYFNETLVKKRDELGIPQDRYARYRWVVDNIEHTPHFHGRAKKLNSTGERVESYETDPFVSKEHSLGLQARIVEHFSSEQVKSEIFPLVDKWVGKQAEQATQTKSAGKLKVAKGELKIEDIDVDNLFEGQRFLTSEGKQLTFIRVEGKGRRGIVLQVKDESGANYALKIVRDEKEETLRSFTKEVEKSKNAKKAGFRVPHIFESGLKFHLKELIEGVLAEQWVAEWAKGGYKKDDPGLVDIKQLIGVSAKRGIYVGDLNRKNLILTKSGWVVIDSGSSTTEYSPTEVLQRYNENISSRWTKKLDVEVRNEFKKALEE